MGSKLKKTQKNNNTQKTNKTPKNKKKCWAVFFKHFLANPVTKTTQNSNPWCQQIFWTIHSQIYMQHGHSSAAHFSSLHLENKTFEWQKVPMTWALIKMPKSYTNECMLHEILCVLFFWSLKICPVVLKLWAFKVW